MAEHLIFLVHGMGKPSSGTYASWKETLRELYGRYAPNGQNIDDHFKFIEIMYDDLFEEQRSRWNDAIGSILKTGTQQGIEMPDERSLKLLSGDHFFGTHILDVLLYRFSPMTAENVRSSVVSQFDAVLGEAPGAQFSILAHSLGTAVAHDAIHALYHSHPKNPQNKLDPNFFHFKTIAMVANVSRLLETDVDVYKSIVRPEKKNVGWNYACRSFLSAAHKWDPFVAPKLFEPSADWPDPVTRSEGLFTFSRPTLFNDWNIHAMEHYLLDPEVHIPLFRYLKFNKWISKTREIEEKKKYREAHSFEEFGSYAGKLKNLILGEGDFTWNNFIAKLVEYYLMQKKIID